MLTRARTSALQERGLTLIELLVAMFVLSIGVLGATTVLTQGQSLSRTGQTREQATAFAEQQIEQLAATPFASLGMASNPTQSANASSPDFYVVASCTGAAGYSIQTNYQTGGTQIACEPFAAVSSGGVVPGAHTISGFQGLSGSFYEYVTSRNEQCVNSSSQSVTCPTTTKRITVAVWPTVSQGAPQKPVWVSTVVGDPATTAYTS